MEKKQKVLLVHNFYQIGGGEHTVYQNEKRLLQENGHEVITYTRSNDELKASFVKKMLLPFTTVFSIKTYREVKSIIKKEKIEIVHCHNTFPLISPSVYYAAWRCKVPVIQTVHNFRFLCPCGVFYHDGKICEDCVHQGLKMAIKNKCYRGSSLQTAVVVNMLKIHRWLGTYQKLHYIFLTEFNREKFRALIGPKVANEFVKPNFEYIDAVAGSNSAIEKDKFVFAARLDENKGVRFLLEAWKQQKNRRLIVFGNGPLENVVREAAKQNPMIEYRGFCDQNQIFSELKTAESFLFTSNLYETFGMTLIESLALGVPVLCSDIGNPADIVSNAHAGICYHEGDMVDFLRKLDKISDDIINKELRENALMAYRKNYTPEVNYGMLKNIYDKVCRENVKG